MPGELDLEAGRPDPEEAAGGRSGGRGDSERSQRRHRADIQTRLNAIFERLAERLEGRGDEELAGIVREDSRAMVGGLTSLIGRAPGLRVPIMGALNVAEPVLAFGRVAGLLRSRWAERRWEHRNAAEAAEAARAEAEAEHGGDGGEEPGPGPWPQQ